MEEIKGKELVKIIIYNFFTSDIVNVFMNILLPCVLSVHCTNFNKESKKWWLITFIIFIVIVLFNIICVIIKNINNKNNKQLLIAYRCYNDQCSINNKFANSIFRLNKTIHEYVTNKNLFDKKSLDKIADFQTFSFSICESVHNILNKQFGEDILCEVTLMKKENNRIKMVAYANNDNKMPSTYKNDYSLESSDICFIRLFNDLNGEILCLPDKDSVSKNFLKLQGSKIREDNICQYIGIPIKTNRNEIELLFQIDVSKPKIFGKNKEEMKKFAKNILYPYAMLLHKTYERDLIFNKYYDMLVMISNK